MFKILKVLPKWMRILFNISLFVFIASSMLSLIGDLSQDSWEYYISKEIDGQTVYVSEQDGSFHFFNNLIKRWDSPEVSEIRLPDSDRWGSYLVRSHITIAVHKKGPFSEKKHIWQFRTRS